MKIFTILILCFFLTDESFCQMLVSIDSLDNYEAYLHFNYTRIDEKSNQSNYNSNFTFPFYPLGNEHACNYLWKAFDLSRTKYWNTKFEVRITLNKDIELATFIIDSFGNVKDPIIVTSLNPIIDQRLIERIINLKSFIPAKLGSINKSVKASFFVKFSEDNDMNKNN